MTNPIIEEVRKARAALAAEHGYDPQRIYEWALAQHQARHKARAQAEPNQSLETTGGTATSAVTRKRRARPSGVSA